MGTKVRLSRIQEQLWLAERLGLHPTGYLARLILEIKGPIDGDALRSSFLDIVTRHEILRTRFFEEDGKLQGEVTPIAELAFGAEFYSEANLTDRGDLATVFAAEAETVLDVSREIPIKVKLIRTADDNHLLSLVLHHLVFDDWSRNQLYSDSLSGIGFTRRALEPLRALLPCSTTSTQRTRTSAMRVPERRRSHTGATRWMAWNRSRLSPTIPGRLGDEGVVPGLALRSRQSWRHRSGRSGALVELLPPWRSSRRPR